MKNHVRRAVFALLAFTMVACSGGSADTAAKGNGAAKGGAKPTPIVPTAASEQINKEFSPVDKPAPPVGVRTPTCPEQFTPSTPPQPQNASFIHAVIDANRDFGAKCPIVKGGAECWIPFTGGWRLMETPLGSIVFQIFENDAKTPVRSPEVGPVHSGGRFSDSTRLKYVVSKGAKKATFRAFLKDASGKVVAESVPQTIPIPSCNAPKI